MPSPSPSHTLVRHPSSVVLSPGQRVVAIWMWPRGRAFWATVVRQAGEDEALVEIGEEIFCEGDSDLIGEGTVIVMVVPEDEGEEESADDLDGVL